MSGENPFNPDEQPTSEHAISEALAAETPGLPGSNQVDAVNLAKVREAKRAEEATAHQQRVEELQAAADAQYGSEGQESEQEAA